MVVPAERRTEAAEDWVELGELCRVHRGAVTGANSTWITDANDLERARIAQGFGFQRLRWLMSLAVRMQAMARASWGSSVVGTAVGVASELPEVRQP